MFLESFILYSLKNYRPTTKLFSLIVKNAFSVLDFYFLFFRWCCFFVSFVFNFFSWGCFVFDLWCLTF
ncbi:hypothetical protein U063_1322 [Helicobacter pylori BM012A]|uniref:Uncharacterized protein n=1 Tax=Helicobacter pylori BM012S TaxID=1407463 RepID=V5NPE4_HELPX|nr:hypothetical protein U063_0689 [Helicobacter pylori BM012A]AHA89614.1 hypothetical protein U064_0691 [Helicobacter pylori BM012S]AHZ28246.1 hypothetical protein EG66_03640 [Helicobacter pylori]AHA88660.1 hypothetical protein U063_1322 [Helicobacter pylori BM012A]AHA90234.1 hypothetical protein U064_1327 [Helicobacter pylori BM012S]